MPKHMLVMFKHIPLMTVSATISATLDSEKGVCKYNLHSDKGACIYKLRLTIFDG